MGLIQLLVKHPEVRRFLHEGDVWRRGQERKRLGIQLSAEDGSEVFLGRHLERHVRGQGQGPVCFWHEWGDDRPKFAEEYRRAQESRLAGGLRDLPGRDQRLLAIPGNKAGGYEEHQHYRLPLAGGRVCGKRRDLCEFGEVAAVEVCCTAASRSGQGRPGDPGANIPESPRAVSEGGGQVPRSDTERIVEIYNANQSVAVRGGQRDKRQGAGRRNGRRYRASD